MGTEAELGSRAGAWRRGAGDRYLDFLCVILLGYALFNRGFAYIGIPPLFLGEVAMLLGLVFWARHPSVKPYYAMMSPWLLLALMGWVGVRTVTEIGTYGLDSIRDAMVIGYGVFAFIVSSLILAEPRRLPRLLERYRQFCYLFLVLTPLIRLFVIAMGGEQNLPTVPGAGVPIIALRMGPVMIHLATITVFLSTHRISWSLVALIALNFVLAATSRGGALAFVATISAALFLRPLSRTIWRLIGLATLCIALLAVSGLEIKLDAAHSHRNISFNMLIDAFISIFGSAEGGSFDDTKKWRMDWWNDIVDYTIFGDYFLTGKGFGINLAKDDGIPQGEEGEIVLRSPHNSHLTILARGGVPALLLWLALNASWARGMILHYRRASLRGEAAWAGVFLFLFGHWLAASVSTSFDVYLEGPMGGIWFWVIVGVGWSSVWLYHRSPQLLRPSGGGPARSIPPVPRRAANAPVGRADASPSPSTID